MGQSQCEEVPFRLWLISGKKSKQKSRKKINKELSRHFDAKLTNGQQIKFHWTGTQDMDMQEIADIEVDCRK